VIITIAALPAMVKATNLLLEHVGHHE